MFSDMRKTLERNLIQHAAGTQMFCPVPECGRILDCKDTVLVTLNDTNDRPLQARTLCGGCWDARREAFETAVNGSEMRLDVTDGRILFPQRKRGAQSHPRRARCRGCSVLHERATMFRARSVKGVWCEACYMGPVFDEIRNLDRMGRHN